LPGPSMNIGQLLGIDRDMADRLNRGHCGETDWGWAGFVAGGADMQDSPADSVRRWDVIPCKGELHAFVWDAAGLR
jgi:hypothetical protein